MKRTILFLFFAVLCLCATAQDLGKLIANAYSFDDRFPRETVYLHMDNAAYIQGDTLWYKAYVVRASTLLPDSTLSRTLYVELLNDAGTLLQRSVLRLDSIGQAHGNFALTQPLQKGFYEIRAYTRAMTNWGGEPAAGYFTKVFPLFELPKKALPGDFTELDILRPESELDFKLPHERPYDFGSKNDRNIEFFPEGGQLAEGTRAHVAFRLTDSHGMPVDDSIAVFSARGELLCKATPEYEGMGSFVLPAAADGAYVLFAGKHEKTALPRPAAAAVALHVYEATDDDSGAPVVNIDLQPAAGMIAFDEDGDAVPLRAAVVVFFRETPYKVYPLELYEGITTLIVDSEDFKPGINRLEVVDVEGLSLASRMIYHTPQAANANPHAPQISVRQNAESYEAFEPIAIEVELKDEEGRPIPFTELSISVRDEHSDLVRDTQPSLSTQLNFCNQLQGYVPSSLLHIVEAMEASSKAEHFSSPRSGGKRGVDLLMLTQGWCPETMEQLCRADSLFVRQPMEDAPIIRGRVIKDNESLEPFPNTDVKLFMYNDSGKFMRAATFTNDEGVFAFEAHNDLVGDFVTQFNVKKPASATDTPPVKRRRRGLQVVNGGLWHRVMIDQWYGPKPKKYSPYEMTLTEPHQAGQEQALPLTEEELFEWTDTIPQVIRQNLSEAVVKKKRKFVFELIGQEFDRYNYGGGEPHSIRHSDTYFNVDLEIQRIRDTGVDVFTIGEFLSYLIGDKDRLLNPDPLIHGVTKTDKFVTHSQIRESIAEPVSGALDEQGIMTPEKVSGEEDNKRIDETDEEMFFGLPETMRVNGLQFYVVYNNHADIPMNQYDIQMPEQLKSVIVSYDASWATRIWKMHNPYSTQHFDGVIYVHTRRDWYNFKRVKGVTKRLVHGYTEPDEFKGPDYRRSDQENFEDFRRTLYWNPRLTTDANGKATAIFYANARWHQHLHITVRGITADGRIIDYER